jgi:hypothetical protein
MKEEDQTQDPNRPGQAGGPTLRPLGEIGPRWVTGWTLLVTAAIPAALIAMTPLAVAFTWLSNLGVRAGLWPALPISNLQPLGFLFALALGLAAGQWYLLRHYLPRAWLWFVVTGAGGLLGGIAAGAILFGYSLQDGVPLLAFATMLLPVGLGLGLAQWLYLRLYVPGAIWIILIDLVAAASLLVAGRSLESLLELALVLILPGAITGIGLWLLLRRLPPGKQLPESGEATAGRARRAPHMGRVMIGLVALIPLFFLCSWVYAASQLALAKNEGIYNSPEEAVIAKNSQGFGGAEVVRIENVRASPNNGNADSPVWFGGATVYMDKAPQGYSWTHYLAGSYYIRVREGWVSISEGAMPEFIGWVMALYDMEGVR